MGSNDNAFAFEEFFSFRAKKNTRAEIIDKKPYAHAAPRGIN